MAYNTKRSTRKPSGVGSVIRSIRLRVDCGQASFAQSLGWPQATLSQYESGDARPSAERLIALLRLAVTEGERAQMLKGLEAYGVLASDLAPATVRPEELPAVPASGAVLVETAPTEETRCDVCGGALVNVVSDGGAAVLCPVCDSESLEEAYAQR